MANTYTQIYIQIVFCVRGRQCLISKDYKEELQKYITGIIQNRNTKLLAIHCMPDHVHIFIGIKPTTLLADLVRDIKAASSKWINDKKWIKGKFSWQEGYGAFSYSHSQLNDVINYINNQEEHHKSKTFGEEYDEFINKYEFRIIKG